MILPLDKIPRRRLTFRALRGLRTLRRMMRLAEFVALLGHMPKRTILHALEDRPLTPATCTWLETIALPNALAAFERRKAQPKEQ